jgi:hypothetical protein
VNVVLWRYEGRRIGWVSCAAPVAALAATVVLTALSAGAGSTRPQLARLLLTGLEAVLPLAVGMAAVTAVARDGCRELHLSLPRDYVATLGRRLAALAVVTAASALAFSLVLATTGLWSGPRWAAAPLVWLSPLLALTGLAVLLAVLGRSVVLATTIVASVWIGEQLFAGALAAHPVGRYLLLFATTRKGIDEHWSTNRLVLTVTGVALVAVAALLVLRPHRLLTEEEE